MNKKLRLLIALALVVLAAYIADIPLPLPQDTPEIGGYYRVMQIFDGDTISIQKDGERVSVRLIGIDTPEVETPYTKAECFGIDASKETRALLNGQMVRIETDPSQALYDAYNRLLAYVYAPANAAPGNLSVNEYLVREGYAREYTFKDPYVHQSEFKADETEAQAARKGLWGACMK